MLAFEVLADPTRRRIVEILAEGERSAGELVSTFRLSQPAVSQHLKRLREAGVVEVRPEAQRRVYSLNPVALEETEQWLARARAAWSSRLDRLEGELGSGTNGDGPR